MKSVKAKMRDNLIARYEEVLPGEIAAQEEGYKTIVFLKSIENREVALVFTAGDAFEKNDNNTWLPDCLWDAV